MHTQIVLLLFFRSIAHLNGIAEDSICSGNNKLSRH